MPEIGTSGSMSGEGKRSDATAPLLDSTLWCSTGGVSLSPIPGLTLVKDVPTRAMIVWCQKSINMIYDSSIT